LASTRLRSATKRRFVGSKKGLVNIKQSRKMKNIPFSSIRSITSEVARLRAQGKDVIDLSLGEPDFDTPRHIVDAMTDAVYRGETHYTDQKGILELRQAISATLKNNKNLAYDPEEIICTVGASEGIYISLTSFLDPGDEMLVPNPAWPLYTHVAAVNEARCVGYSLTENNGFQIDVNELETKISPRTKILLLLDPSNPVGCTQKKETLKQVAECCIKHNLLVLSDEIYDKIVYDGQENYSIAGFPGMRERTIVLNGFAKAYAMTGWCLGYTAAPTQLTDVMARLHMYLVPHASVMVQWGGLAALTGPQEPVQKMVAEFQRRRDFIHQALNEIRGLSCVKPSGAFYIFLNIAQTGMTSDEFTLFLLREADVGVAPGSAFGSAGEGYVRISYATSMKNLEQAATRISKAMNR
jgi:aminotransferase